MKTKPFKRSNVLKFFLICFFTVSVILPLFKMLLTMKETNFIATITAPTFVTALMQSLLVSVVSTLFSVLVSTILAWCMTRTNIKAKIFWTIIFTLPVLIPSISHGMGLIVLFGNKGVLTSLFNIHLSIYGFWGIVIGSILYTFPISFLMIVDILQYQDSTPSEAAEVLGISKFRQFLAITIPYMRKPMISVFFAVFTMIVTDYGVPIMVGGKYSTLPVMMYHDIIEQLNFGKGSVIGLVLLIPAVIAFILDLINKDKNDSSHVSKPFRIKKSKTRDSLSYVFCILISIIVLLPIVVFILLTFVKKYPINLSITFDNIKRAFDMQAGKYLVNSLVISTIVSIVGIISVTATAYLTARMSSKTSAFLHLTSITSLAIPGIVLGLSYALFFKTTFIYNTLAILILINLVHFFASPYLMMYNTFGKIDSNIESVGASLGVSRFKIITDVILPQSRLTIIEAFSYFFLNSMMTISAVSFLYTPETKPLALMITSFEKNMLLEAAAFVSLMILIVNLIFKGIMNLIKRRVKKKMA